MTGGFARVVEGVFGPGDRAEEQVQTVAVEIHEPIGRAAPGIVVELEFDRTGDAVIDLGLRSPAGHRGWSGGARSRIVVGEDYATPGYLQGPLPTGVWEVLLGLHRVADAGTAYRLTIRTATPADVEADRRAQPTDPSPPPRPPVRELPASAGLTWLAADFHAHTVHSDGVLSVGGLAALAVERGLQVLAVTDHNTISHHQQLSAAARRYAITLVPGQEITTDRGHANAFGDIGFVDFTEPAAHWAAVVADRGGLLSVNHPVAGDCAWRHDLPGGPGIAEVWHSSWAFFPTWGAPLAWWLQGATRAVPIGGSDFHHPGADGLPGAPTTWVACQDPDGSDALDALAAGRCAISAAPTGPVLLRVGDDLVALDAPGSYLTGPTGRRRLVSSDRQAFALSDLDAGPWWLEGARMEILALTG